MIDRRTEILNGILQFPAQIRTIINPKKHEDVNILIDEFWDNIWHNFLREKASNAVLWLTKFNDNKRYNHMLMLLSKAGWITSEVDGNYAYVQLNESKLMQWIDKDELLNIKFRYKFIKYRLQDTKSILCDIVQNNGKYMNTGLVRNGFMKAGNNKFRYDTKYLSKYVNEIAENVKKGLRNSTKDITYQEIIDELLNYYSIDGTEYTLGNCHIDSRGRAIFHCSKKVFNPVSCKDARALLICEGEWLTYEGKRAIYAAISELLGYRGKNYEDKVWHGQNAYILREVPDIEEMHKTKDYSDLHVLIWLERIYDNLDAYMEDSSNKWYVPIELDAMASMIQMIAVLTNDYEYMQKTNMVPCKEGFQDIWSVPYVSRNHVKKAMTPQLYGSGKHTRQLWDANELEYSQVQLNLMTKDMTTGIFANANSFKDFIINNVKPKVTMFVNVNEEIFEVECNRFKWEETIHIENYIYTSAQGLMKKVSIASTLVPDTNQFKRYFVTCLIHNLDSQVCNIICQNVDWVLPNHDSFTIHPNDATYVRDIYTAKMKNIWTKRKRILKDYFDSIGITKEYKEQEDQKYPQEYSIALTGFSPYCLK